MLSFTDHWIGYIALAVFLAAYVLVIVEENLDLRKSKPVMVAAGAIWILTAIAYASQHQSHAVAEILRHNLLEYAELMLFLLSAMTFINTMVERNIFTALRTRLVSLPLVLASSVLADRHVGFYHFSCRGQSDDGVGDGSRGDGHGGGQRTIHQRCLHQCGGCGQRGRCV